MNTDKMLLFGAYVAGQLDSAAVRGSLTAEAMQTLIRGLVSLHQQSGAKYSVPWEASQAGVSAPNINLNDPQMISRITDELQRRQQAIVGSEAQRDPPAE